MVARKPPIGAPPRPSVVTSSRVLPTRRRGRAMVFPREFTGVVGQVYRRGCLAQSPRRRSRQGESMKGRFLAAVLLAVLLPVAAQASDCIAERQGDVAIIEDAGCGDLRLLS